jgi:(1->4)-alpha-D-glucan 1-alpha-D-glucosylmutase
MLLKVTAPGIPDFYQGTELWSYTLVDPDNRGPVDFDVRHRLFEDIAAIRDTPDPAAVRALLESWEDGRVKLLVTAVALRFRATHRDVFEEGDFIHLEPTGARSDHIFAFARLRADHACLIVLPRWTAALGDSTLIDQEVWGDTSIPLPPQLRLTWHNALTGETLRAGGALHVAALLRSVPFALLEVSQPIGA